MRELKPEEDELKRHSAELGREGAEVTRERAEQARLGDESGRKLGETQRDTMRTSVWSASSPGTCRRRGVRSPSRRGVR